MRKEKLVASGNGKPWSVPKKLPPGLRPSFEQAVFKPGVTHTPSQEKTCECGHLRTDTHACTHHRGKLRQFLGTQADRRKCRQTDDYLHDKDLKYSPSKRFPLKLFHNFPCAAPVQASWFWHKGYFSKGLRDAGFDSTSARTAGGEQRSCIVVFPAENHLMLSRSTQALPSTH